MPSLVDYHIGRLKDKNPRVRAESARELGLIGDTAALPALEDLFTVETDPLVKKEAQEAGRILYKKKKLEDEAGEGGA
jgi:HEAT repeat protein